MPLTPKEMIRLLLQNGSHQKYFNPQQNITVAVPLHTKELKKGLEQAILKQAGLKR